MADVVQYRMEQMVDELDDLEKKGIFTRQEIKEIVNKRRKFEYRLKRPSPLKQDFLTFIDYEKQVDSLRRLRKKSVSRELVEMGKKRLKRSISDRSGIRRILRIFHLAATRFKGDLHLWFQYLEFCKEYDHARMKKVLAQVIRFHPKYPGLWIYAAAWEFDHNLNVVSARRTILRGLRSCPHSEDLWVEYLRMELTYLNKLKTRKALLGEDSGKLIRDHDDHQDEDDKQWKDENKDLFMSLDEEKTNLDSSEIQQEGEGDDFQEQATRIFQTVYSGAVEAIPFSLNLRKQFLEIFDDLELARLGNFREEILEGMKKDFAKDPEYWKWLARFEVLDYIQAKKLSKEDLHIQLDKAARIYEEALENVPSSKMFSLYAKFWMDVISPEGDDSQTSEIPHISDFGAECIPDLLKVYEKAETMGCMLDDLACQYVSLYLRLGRLEEARAMAAKLCEGKFSEAVKLWELRISIEIKWITSKSSFSKEDVRSIFKLVQEILGKVAISEAEGLWHMAIKFFSSHKEYFDKLVQTFMALIARYTEGGFSVSSAIVNFTLQRDGIGRAREMYKRLLALPHPSLALHRTCIDLESNLAYIGDKDALVNARKVYESAVTTYSQDVGLWRDYYSLEAKVGTSETATGVYWRARKTLRDNTGLIAPQDF